jgi:hypothetical protein
MSLPEASCPPSQSFIACATATAVVTGADNAWAGTRERVSHKTAHRSEAMAYDALPRAQTVKAIGSSARP